MGNRIRIAIDGPSGAGKSSVAHKVALVLGVSCLDTGAMYRAVGLYMMRQGIPMENGAEIARRAPEAHVEVIETAAGEQRVLLNGEDVTELVHQSMYSRSASFVSAVSEVRELVVAQQQAFARERSVVMEGRDIGTVVLPEAELKIFLVADPRVRAERRYRQICATGGTDSLEAVYAALIERDKKDIERTASPLRKAEDAVELDATHMTEDEVVTEIVRLAKEALR